MPVQRLFSCLGLPPCSLLEYQAFSVPPAHTCSSPSPVVAGPPHLSPKTGQHYSALPPRTQAERAFPRNTTGSGKASRCPVGQDTNPPNGTPILRGPRVRGARRVLSPLHLGEAESFPGLRRGWREPESSERILEWNLSQQYQMLSILRPRACAWSDRA